MAKFVFSGKAYYSMVYEGNHDEYGGKEFYKITLALDGSSWSKFNRSGLSLKVKKLDTDSGEEDVVTFKRDVHPKTGVDKNGRPWTLGGGAPRVVDEHGDEFDKLIGNGSEVEVLIDVYTVAKGPMKGKRGHRLDAIKILKHIPYDPDVFEDDFDDLEDEENLEGEVDTVVEETETKKSRSKNTKGLPF